MKINVLLFHFICAISPFICEEKTAESRKKKRVSRFYERIECICVKSNRQVSWAVASRPQRRPRLMDPISQRMTPNQVSRVH